MGVLGEFKRGVDVAHGDWFGVREGTHLLGVHPLHPYVFIVLYSTYVGLLYLGKLDINNPNSLLLANNNPNSFNHQ
ncbi:hypothetical protein Hanom_Chr05g00444371 [Helianthus anomalus]